MSRPAKLHIDIKAFQHNLNRIREFAPHSKIMAMIKANAYGHGLSRAAKALEDADAFGVACLEEAIIIRGSEISKPIVLMTGFFTVEELLKIIVLNCEIVIHHFEQIELLEHCRLPTPLKAWLKINTGMNRLGFTPESVYEAYKRLEACKNIIKPFNLMTHFADADDPREPSTAEQINIFKKVTNHLSGEKSLANSAGILAFSESHADWVRPGGLLYGVSTLPDDVGKNHGLKPVMTLQSKIIALRYCHKGDAIGYGGTWQCPENMPVGIVAIGYGDGYPRSAKCGTPVLVNGYACPLVGRVAMDMLTVDLRSYAKAKVNDDVILWGDDLPVEKIAACANTISYELLCGIARRVDGAS